MRKSVRGGVRVCTRVHEYVYKTIDKRVCKKKKCIKHEQGK